MMRAFLLMIFLCVELVASAEHTGAQRATGRPNGASAVTVPVEPPEELQRLVTQLGAENYQSRRLAHRQIQRLIASNCSQYESFLQRFLQDRALSVDVQRSLARLLRETQTNWPAVFENLKNVAAESAEYKAVKNAGVKISNKIEENRDHLNSLKDAMNEAHTNLHHHRRVLLQTLGDEEVDDHPIVTEARSQLKAAIAAYRKDFTSTFEKAGYEIVRQAPVDNDSNWDVVQMHIRSKKTNGFFSVYAHPGFVRVKAVNKTVDGTFEPSDFQAPLQSLLAVFPEPVRQCLTLGNAGKKEDPKLDLLVPTFENDISKLPHHGNGFLQTNVKTTLGAFLRLVFPSRYSEIAETELALSSESLRRF